MYFNDQMFNPSTVNPCNYQAVRGQIPQLLGNQDIEVMNAVKAVHELCQAVKKLDESHQRTAFLLCLDQMATDFNWR